MEKLSFQGKWRSYQKQVLDELDTHLDNNHLHIVAAPGSGKTILGLEVMRRLGKPALVLAPTITIRNQWAQRLSMFLPAGSPQPDWISHDIKSPKTVTIITYQALHAAFSGQEAEEEESTEAEEENGEEKHDEEETPKRKNGKSKEALEAIITQLKKKKIQTVVLDEAHHLRNEWWKALTKLKEELGKPTIVALTATPPYDVEYTEWQRYQELCGPIDAEISVPELVLQIDLCPHQDYVYFSLPRTVEAEKLEQFRREVQQFIQTLLAWEEFKTALLQHPWIASPNEQVEAILGDASFFSSMLIFLHETGIKPPRKTLDILGVHYNEIPEMTHQWLETLLNGALYTYRESFAALEKPLDEMQRHLRRIGALELRKVCLSNPKAVQKLLASSTSKLDAIVDITSIESKAMNDGLRMVILSDFIRKSEMPSKPEDLRPIDKMGVIPIFESLRRAGIGGIKLGVLTGSLIFIPAESKALLDNVARNLDIDLKHIRYSKTDFDDAFLRVEIIGEQKQNIVRLITELFGQGGITVLVGTQALLGEGWDAPSVNTLILASTVGSYMLSNQMRGRAIRIDSTRPQKTSNIWHLAAVDPETLMEKIEYFRTGKTTRQKIFDPFDDLKQDLGNDVNTLKRRFRAFEGLSFHEPATIENGFRRLALGNVDWKPESIGNINYIMKQRAADRAKLHEIWKEALQGRSPHPKMHETLESNYTPKTLAYQDTIKFLVIQSIFWTGIIASQGLRGRNIHSLKEVAVVLFFGFIAGAIITLPKTLKALWLWFRNGSLEGNIKQVGMTVLETLHHMNIIKTGLNNMRVESTQDKSGIVYCRLEGATTIERSYFLEALQELLSPVENPRYVLVRPSMLWRFGRIDYHTVPSIIGQKKENAEYFARLWNRYVGSSKLVYTRSVEGRLTLLQARTKALSSVFRKKTDRISRWQ